MDLQPFLEHLVQRWPWLSVALLWIGAARTVCKWINAPLQARCTAALVRLAEDDDGSEMVHRLLTNRAYRVLNFLLDLTTSLKLPTHASFHAALTAGKPAVQP